MAKTYKLVENAVTATKPAWVLVDESGKEYNLTDKNCYVKWNNDPLKRELKQGFNIAKSKTQMLNAAFVIADDNTATKIKDVWKTSDGQTIGEF